MHVAATVQYIEHLTGLRQGVSVRLHHEKRSILEVKAVFLRRHGKRTFFMTALDTSQRFWQHPVLRLGRTKKNNVITDFGALVDCKAPNAFKTRLSSAELASGGNAVSSNLRITFCLC